MFSKNVKATLLCGPKELSVSFMFEIAMYWAGKGQSVVYIMPAPLERPPAGCHDRCNPAIEALKLMRLIYLSNYDALMEQLIKLHTYAVVPSVLLIDELDNYLHDDTIGNDSSMHTAKTCALILHSMKSCSRALKTNVHVCAWTNSIFANNCIRTIYFHNIWNLTEKEEEGKNIILLEKFSASSTSGQSYKYYKFQDGIRVLKQILSDQ